MVHVTTMEQIFSFDSNDQSTPIDLCVQSLLDLFKKYENDTYIISKIQHYITRQLPMLISNLKESRVKSIERTNELTITQEQFMYRFLQTNRYFYMSPNEKFFSYDGLRYKETSEDHILHHIVTSINQERNVLMNWKHKTKVSTLKKIKDNALFSSIPESYTIQNVLHLCGLFFKSKKESKYFLTILGDNLMKKHLELIHFVHPSLKILLREINNHAILYFNSQCTQTFKIKCHEKHYEMDNKLCRLVPVGDFSEDFSIDPIKENILDLLCVACHYSIRYQCSDSFVNIYNTDYDLIQYVYKLKNTPPEIMLEEFSNEYLYQIKCENTVLSSSPIDHYIIQCNKGTEKPIDANNQISWKSMLYLWKDYLRLHKYPLNLYQMLSKQILTQKIFPNQFDVRLDAFRGIGSSKMPIVYRFLKFWSENMTDAIDYEYELEIEEVSNLFSIWTNKLYNKRKIQLTEEEIMDILHYYYPDLEIEKDKYIYKKKCLLWDKDMDIDAAVYALQENCKEEMRTISLYDAYDFYCRFFQTGMCVSKSYFEKYMGKKYGKLLSDDGILSSDWIDFTDP